VTTDRRQFLKMAGVMALGLGLKPVLQSLLGGEVVKASEELLAQGDGQGRRWAMVVDLPRCWSSPGCTDCIAACDAVHNIPHLEDERKAVRWLWQEPYGRLFRGQDPRATFSEVSSKAALVMCNHCENPPCVRVCPTGATWKRGDGIVMMDFHRCIGCRYCMVACPYGARSYNFVDPRQALDMTKVDPGFPTRTRGVVEKCTLCSERIDRGGIPACVEGCSRGALLFGDINDPKSEVRRVVETRLTLVRRPEMGTKPRVYYVVS